MDKQPRVLLINGMDFDINALLFNKFKKKQIIIKACQLETKFTVKTLEGDMKGNKGDYLIIGIEGEFYPCKKEIFEKTYDLVQEIVFEDGRLKK